MRRADVLAAWKASPWAPDAVVSGMVDGTRRIYDPICSVTPAGEVDATVVVDPAFRTVGGPAPVDAEAAIAWLYDPSPMVRIAAIRRLGNDLDLPDDLVLAAHMAALSNDTTGVRQHASVHLSGFSARGMRADMAILLDLFRRGEVRKNASDGWDEVRARRDLRYAVLWIAANLARALAVDPAPWRREALEVVREDVARTEVDHARVAAWVQADAEGELGTEEGVQFGELLRFALLRGPRDDAFAWLDRDARLVMGWIASAR